MGSTQDPSARGGARAGAGGAAPASGPAASGAASAVDGVSAGTSAAQPRLSSGSAGASLFVLMRRLRQPLLMLVIVYATAILGFTLIPGIDAEGRPTRMSFLHAVYFVSYLGTSIGLGEVPGPFSDAQRLWTTAVIYLAVFSWLFAAGRLIQVLQDPAVKSRLKIGKLERGVQRMSEPFYLLCGYDDAGYRVTRELTENGSRVVVLDDDAMRVEAADLDEHRLTVLALQSNAADAQTLLSAGVRSPHCAAVLALTGDDRINTQIAQAAALLNPQVSILCAVRDHDWHERVAAVGAHHLINPFDNFATRLGLAIRMPSLHVIYEALTTQTGTAFSEPPVVPRGHWALCGTDQLVRDLIRQLRPLGVKITWIRPEGQDAETAAFDDVEIVAGDPWRHAVLRQSHIDEVDALVASTESDMDNLGIMAIARRANKKIFTLARQNERRNTELFKAAQCAIVFRSGYVIAAEVLRLIRAPLLSSFLRKARDQDEAWAAALLARMRESIGHDIVESWALTIACETTPAAIEAIRAGSIVTPRRILMRVLELDSAVDHLRAVPLLLVRGSERVLVPDVDIALQEGDRLLFCGRDRARRRMLAMAFDTRPLPDVALDTVEPSGTASDEGSGGGNAGGETGGGAGGDGGGESSADGRASRRDAQAQPDDEAAMVLTPAPPALAPAGNVPPPR